MKKRDITPRDEKGCPHGYWERYYANSELKYKGNYIHSDENGYWEFYRYYDYSVLYKKIYYIR